MIAKEWPNFWGSGGFRVYRDSNSKFYLMMIMMMNCFCDMFDWRKAFSLISSRDYCQRSSSSRISDTPRVGFEPVQNLSSGLVEWSCAVAITTTLRRHKPLHHGAINHCTTVPRLHDFYSTHDLHADRKMLYHLLLFTVFISFRFIKSFLNSVLLFW